MEKMRGNGIWNIHILMDTHENFKTIHTSKHGRLREGAPDILEESTLSRDYNGFRHKCLR